MKSFKEFLIENNDEEKEIEDLKSHMRELEASKGKHDEILKLHFPQSNDPTIGFGHSLQNKEGSKKVFETLFSNELKQNPNFFNDLYDGKTSMTMDQVEKLLDYDVRSRMPIVRKLPDYSAYSPELKRRLFGMAYRGSLQQSPKARELMSQGRFDLASDEYLNSDEYKASRDQRPKKGKTDVPGRGVATRMEKDAQMIASEFERLPPGVIGTKQHGPLKPGLESYSEKMANVQAQIPVQTISQQTEPVDNSYYTIGKGDSLSAIAKKHNTTVDALSKLNKINDPNKIQMGQKLRLR